MFLNCKEPSKVLERSIGAYKFERKGGRDRGGGSFGQDTKQVSFLSTCKASLRVIKAFIH